MADTYWEDPSGIVWFVQDGADPAPDWTEVTQGEYDAWYADQQATIAANKATQANVHCLKRKHAYNDLHAKIPTLTIQTLEFLTGYHAGDC